MNGAGGKAEGLVGMKTHHFPSGIDLLPDGLPGRIDAFEKADGLKKIKPIPFLKKHPF